MAGLVTVGNESRASSVTWGAYDLAAVDALQIDTGDAEVRMPELTLNDDQRDTLVGHLDRISVPELMRRKSAPDAGFGGRMM